LFRQNEIGSPMFEISVCDKNDTLFLSSALESVVKMCILFLIYDLDVSMRFRDKRMALSPKQKAHHVSLTC